MKYLNLTFLTFFVFASCGKSNSTATAEVAGSCSSLENQITSLLSAVEATDNLPYTYLIERLSDGRQFSYSKTGSTADTLYESASTSKIVSAVIILRAVDNGDLSLDDKPQDHLTTAPVWPILNTDPLYSVTLSHLLSFTSGLTTEPACQNLGAANFVNCINTIATTNAGGTVIPGNEFNYGSNHLQVAGLMTMRAKAMTTWQQVYSDFQATTGLFTNSTYDLPSATNPRLAGGMHWTANEFIVFLRKLAKGQLLTSAAMTTFLQDQTASTTMTYSPIQSSTLNEQWHYGYGYWHECQNTTWNCVAATRISSPGAYGAYPFWDRSNGYIGIVARQSPATGTFPYGVTIERAVRSLSQQWASCQ